jgi:GNAT superfamily N-acetyltransferase
MTATALREAGAPAVERRASYSVGPIDWTADEPAVLELLRASMPGDARRWSNAAVWRWKHVHNPFGRSLVLVARDDATGKITGLRAFMAWQYLVGGAPTLAYRPVDTATDPSCRRMGIFARLTTQALERARAQGAGLMFNTPNQMSVGGYLKMGWTLVTRSRTTVKICSYPRFALKYSGSRLFRRGAAEASTSSDDGSVRRFLSDEPAVRSLIAADAAWKRDRIVTDRSVAYLAWRFGSHPVYAYSAVTVGGADGVGFFRQIERGGLRWLLLQEMLLRSPDPKIAAELVRKAQRTFKPDFMTAFVPPGSFERRALRACGFRWTVKGGSNFVANALAPDLPLDPTRLASWSLSLCDLEFF